MAVRTDMGRTDRCGCLFSLDGQRTVALLEIKVGFWYAPDGRSRSMNEALLSFFNERLTMLAKCFRLLTIFLIGCAVTTCSNSSSTNYVGMSAPGDTWTLNLTSENKFSLANTTPGHETGYSGLYIGFPTGFTKLYVRQPFEQSAYYASNGDVVFLWLGQTSSPVIILAPQQGCPNVPSTASTYNFVAIPPTGANPWSVNSGLAKGTMVDMTNGVFTFTESPTSIGGAPINPSPPEPAGYTCSGGVFAGSYANGVSYTTNVNLTASGILIRDDGLGRGGATGAKQLDGPIISSLTNLNYIGFQSYQTNGTMITQAVTGRYVAVDASINTSVGIQTCPAQATVEANVNQAVSFCISLESVNPESGAADGIFTQMIPITADSNTGWLTGTIYGTSEAQFLVANIRGTYVLYGVTYTPSTTPYNLMLVQR